MNHERRSCPPAVAVSACPNPQPERGQVALECFVGILGVDRRHVAGGHDQVVDSRRAAVDALPVRELPCREDLRTRRPDRAAATAPAPARRPSLMDATGSRRVRGRTRAPRRSRRAACPPARPAHQPAAAHRAATAAAGERAARRARARGFVHVANVSPAEIGPVLASPAGAHLRCIEVYGLGARLLEVLAALAAKPRRRATTTPTGFHGRWRRLRPFFAPLQQNLWVKFGSGRHRSVDKLRIERGVQRFVRPEPRAFLMVSFALLRVLVRCAGGVGHCVLVERIDAPAVVCRL